MNKIKWCKLKGLSLTEPNKDLSKDYLKKAYEAFESIDINIYNDWKIIISYYSLYYSLYSILTKIGIKSEIHTCTIEFAKIFLNEHFNEKDIIFLSDSFIARKDSQYFINKRITQKEIDNIKDKIPDFIIKCKNIKLTDNKIKEIRNIIKNL